MNEPNLDNINMHKVENSRLEVADFVLKNGIPVVRLGQNKNPRDTDWTNPAVYEPKQNEWIDGFLHNYWYLGAICGVKCKNGYYLVVWDAVKCKYCGYPLLPEEEPAEMCERCFTLFIMELYKNNPNVSFVDSDNNPTTDPDKVEWFKGLGFKKGSKYAPKS